MAIKKKTNAQKKPPMTVSWRGWVVLTSLLLALFGCFVLVVLTPRGQPPEAWLISSWLDLWKNLYP
jgi:hypothetical protein